MAKVVETLLYALKPGTGAEFDRIMHDISVPLHRQVGMDVVAYGISLHDQAVGFPNEPACLDRAGSPIVIWVVQI